MAQFAYFNRLPAEIRHIIWRLALSQLAVWYTTHPHINLLALPPIIPMRPVGIAPYQVGFACKESRYLLEKMYTRVTAHDSSNAATTGSSAVYWLLPDLTIMYLGCLPRAINFLDFFHAHHKVPLKHVVIRWSDPISLILFAYQMAEKCYNPRTYILHADIQRWQSCHCEEPPLQILTDWYKAIAVWPKGYFLPYEEHCDADILESLMGTRFSERKEQDEEYKVPRFHFLPFTLKPAVSGRNLRLDEISRNFDMLITELFGSQVPACLKDPSSLQVSHTPGPPDPSSLQVSHTPGPPDPSI